MYMMYFINITLTPGDFWRTFEKAVVIPLEGYFCSSDEKWWGLYEGEGYGEGGVWIAQRLILDRPNLTSIWRKKKLGSSYWQVVLIWNVYISQSMK